MMRSVPGQAQRPYKRRRCQARLSDNGFRRTRLGLKVAIDVPSEWVVGARYDVPLETITGLRGRTKCRTFNRIAWEKVGADAVEIGKLR